MLLTPVYWLYPMRINRPWLADTLALISFTVVTGLFVELVIVGMTLQQALLSRLMCQPVNLFTARPYGVYRDHVMKRVCGGHDAFWRRALSDMLAFVSFQLPLYVMILITVGLDAQGILAAAVSQTASLVVLGAPYGLWLGWVRKRMLKPELSAA